MAGFLRKKNKEAPVKPVPSSPIPLGAAANQQPAVPPLFARFATSNKSENAPLIVSSPKVLVRKELPQRVSNRANGQPTQTAAAKKRSTQNQVQTSVQPPRPLTPPAPIVNKPLPPPSPPPSTADPSGSTPPQSFIPVNKQSRSPPVFKNQPLNAQVESNTSSSFPSSFSSAQTSTSSPASKHVSTSNNSLTSPSKRNPTLSNAPQILPPIVNRKITQQNPPPPTFGRQNLPPTSAQTQMLHPSQSSSLANQDLQPATLNVDIPLSKIGASSTHMQQSGTQGTSVSDRNLDIDLPPEFATMFHNFNEQFNFEDRISVDSIKSNNDEHVPASNVPRSPLGTTPRALISTTDPDQHLLPPPLPPKSTESDMGVASSSLVIGNGLPSSTKDFYSPRVVNGRTSSSYNPAANQPQMLNQRLSPPLPSVPAASPPPLLKQDLKFSPRNGVPSNRTTHHPADPNLQNSGSPPPRKSILQSPTVGKPRIFSMTAQVDELDRETASSFSGPPPPPYSANKKQQQPSQSLHVHHQQPQSQQHQPSATEWKASTNGSDSFKPVFSSSAVQPPSTPPFKFAQNHKVEQQLPPTPPSQNRGGSRLSRKPDGDGGDVQRPQQHTVVNGSSRSRKDLKPDEEPRPQSKNVLQSSPRSRKDSKSDEQRRQSQPILQTLGSDNRKNSKRNEEPPRPQSQQVPPQSSGSRSKKNLKSDEPPPRTPSRTRKLSNTRPEVVSQYNSNNNDIVLPGTPDSHHHHQSTSSSVRTLMTKSRSPKSNVAPLEPAIQLDEDTKSKAGIISADDYPFARVVEGVTLLTPPLSSPGESMLGEEQKEDGGIVDGGGGGSNEKELEIMKYPSISSLNSVGSEKLSVSPPVIEGVVAPLTPVSPEEPRKTTATKKKKKKKRRDDDIQTEPMLDNSEFTETVTTTTTTTSTAEYPEIEPEPEPILPAYTIIDFLSDPQLLSSLLTFFTFYDWCLLSSLSKEIRKLLVQSPVLRETVLERFLKTVGYSRWIWDDPDPLLLSLQDLNDYMRGVSTPTHEYARVAGMYIHSLTIHPKHRDPSLIDTVRILTASTRAYTRVILRLRAQAEKEAILAQQSRGLGITMKKPPSFNSSYYPPSSSSVRNGNHSRVSSRAPSPTTSNGAGSSNGLTSSMQETTQNSSSMGGGLMFRSPLFRLRRAPLLRVFVPSPEGDWLSDKSVLACEEEFKRAGVMHLIRLGDVIWDVAVGDEGNVGRLVWDGSYLIDLDYTYTSIGDLPKYIHALAFPPSYFHRVIRTGPVVSNPIVHMDISPWGEEIAMNLQLLQDRVRTETPQGAYHNVVRWVHRSSFVIRPGPARFTTTSLQGGGGGGKTQMLVSRIPIPDTDNNLFVDSGWHGTVVVETEGTNEALADLQERCGPGVFPPRSRGVPQMSRIQVENKKVFRVLREKSRPGEIWIKTVGIKERIM